MKKGHFPSITDPEKIGDYCGPLMGTKMDSWSGALAPLVSVHNGELRGAEWTEIDIGKAKWRIKAEQMKARVQHIVPLSRQALAVLRELRPNSGDTRFVFPSERIWTQPMSENTVNAGLRRLGYSTTELTAHGFRSMASTLLNEQAGIATRSNANWPAGSATQCGPLTTPLSTCRSGGR